MNSTLLDIFQGFPKGKVRDCMLCIMIITIVLFSADPAYLPLFSTPVPAIIIILIYLLVIFKIGPDFMKFRKPYDVRRAMLIYNAFQIAMNAAIFSIIFYYLFVKKVYDIWCMEALPLDHPLKYIARLTTYAYFLNKVLDMCDTLFFVLRKSYKQVTVLHVYHHSLMVLGVPTTYYFYGSGGPYNLMGCINSFVHVVMYGYYFAAALYPVVKNKLWLKKSITQMQIVQFIIVFCHASLTWGLNTSCSIPWIIHFAEMVVAVSMMVMFGNFYYQTYVRVKSKSN
ncbi:hypothetical protein KR032_011554 [Drosophila birchii]|nr:hypothetical protein KR032_011554 [Drosophila birchii]